MKIHSPSVCCDNQSEKSTLQYSRHKIETGQWYVPSIVLLTPGDMAYSQYTGSMGLNISELQCVY